MNVRSSTDYALMLGYLLGNAMTYNHLRRVGRATIAETDDASFLIVKNLLTSTVWPLYWLYYVAG